MRPRRACWPPAPGEWYFAGRRNGEPHSAWTRGKAELDTMLNIEHWVLHDLRRTHVIEATLNHTVPGVAGVYRRHNFVEEKKAALEALASLLATIVE